MGRLPKVTPIPPEVWHLLDWNRPASVIAKELNVEPRTVYGAAKRYGKTLPRVTPGVKPRIDWSQVDFDSSTRKELAKKLGVTPTWVSMMHKRQMHKRQQEKKGR